MQKTVEHTDVGFVNIMRGIIDRDLQAGVGQVERI